MEHKCYRLVYFDDADDLKEAQYTYLYCTSSELEDLKDEVLKLKRELQGSRIKWSKVHGIQEREVVRPQDPFAPNVVSLVAHHFYSQPGRERIVMPCAVAVKR